MRDYNKKRLLSDGQTVLGVIEGKTFEKVFLIIGGQDCSIYGFKNKYLVMGLRLLEKTGCTVFVASNPFDESDKLGIIVDAINEHCALRGCNNIKISYLGHSNGSTLFARYGHYYYQFREAILVNLPLKISSYHNVLEGIKKSKLDNLTLIYSEYDLSTSRIDWLSEVFSKINKIVILESIDHDFTYNLGKFIKLPETYFLSEVKK